MQKKYVRPSSAIRTIQRYKRKAPAFVVDVVDSFYRLLDGGMLKYPYCIADDAYQPFFIIGSGRSGNTLLRKLLMERAKVVIPPEIPGLGSTIRQFSQSGAKDWPDVVEDVIAKFQYLADIDIENLDSSGKPVIYNLSTELGVDFNKINKELKQTEGREHSLEKIISSIYQAYSLRVFGEVLPWGDKTPWNAFHYERIKKVFPNAKYIHMVRDGRDCIASYVESLGKLMNLDARSAAYRWRDSVRASKKIKEDCAGRFFEVRYEDLVASTEDVVFDVAKFLELSRVEYKRVEAADLGEGNSLHHKKLNFPVDSSSIGKWKNKLSKEELDIVYSIIAKDLKILGYM